MKTVSAIATEYHRDTQRPDRSMETRAAREELETKTGRSVVSPLSAKRFFESQKRNEIEDNGNEK